MTFEEFAATKLNDGPWDDDREVAKAAWDAAVRVERDRILAIVHKYAHTDYACQSEGVDVARDIESEINA